MSITPRTFAVVSDLVRRESAIVLAPGKEYLVESRLLTLARAGGHADVDAYVADLERRRTPATVRAVVEALTTNETSWFRDSAPFDALRQVVLPELAARRAGRPLRIWSAACSSGQEPYSISMVVQDTPALAGQRVEILGTDLSEEMVERARAGEYSQLEVNRGLPATSLVRWFQRAGVGWRVDPQVASRVSFRTLNLVRPFPPMGRFDVVVLRNVLIYFDLPTKRDVLRRVADVLAPDGYLFLGAAETTTGVDDAWERVPVGKASIYKPRSVARTGVA